MTKYIINYDELKVLSYNVYFKSMLGIDKKYLPQKKAQLNVRNILDNNYDIIGIQEAECLDNIFPNTNNEYNLITGKSGKETMVTVIKKNYNIILSEMTEFVSGRGILLVLIDNGILIVNIHAPHIYNDFGNYKGTTFKEQLKYNNEFNKILTVQINKFMNNMELSRIIILGDFNEAYNHTNKFKLKINKVEYIMRTSKNKPFTCCNTNFTKANDLIYDSINCPELFIPKNENPASDHLPVATLFN